MGEVVDGIDIELTRGGSLVGTIAPGRDGSLARHVVLSNGDGAPLSWPVAPDGTFHVDHLTPGPWNVRVNPRAVSYFEGNMEMVFDATTCELPSNCVIREGETTTLTLTADDTLAAVVHGKVSGIDDPARWCARIAGFRGDIDQTPAPSHDSGWLAQIGEDGSFELRFEIGRRKIILWPNRDMSAKPSQCAFVWTDDLHEGPQTFEATLALGRIEGDVGSVAADRPLFVEADATTSGGLEFHARMLVDASGHFVFADAPAGEVRLHVPKTEIARTVTVSAGATATIQLR
jgi:hypothetical protein